MKQEMIKITISKEVTQLMTQSYTKLQKLQDDRDEEIEEFMEEHAEGKFKSF